jgi:hypothetical protein
VTCADTCARTCADFCTEVCTAIACTRVNTCRLPCPQPF